jgi:small subunit ribosomal protein S17
MEKNSDKVHKKEPKRLIGQVVSDKMDKTIVVKVERTYTDTKLNKVVRTFKKYKVHDEQDQAKEGDVVEIFEGRPKSKEKYMYLAKVIKRVQA